MVYSSCIMKILSKMIVSCRRIKWLGLCIFFLLSLQSCDIGFTLPLGNNKFSYDIPYLRIVWLRSAVCTLMAGITFSLT